MKGKLEKTLLRIRYFTALKLAILRMLSSPYSERRYLGLANLRVAVTN
jgi:hypothetical protein